MGPVTNIADRALHLVLFLVAAVAVGVTALAVLERLVSGERPPTIRGYHVAIPIIVTALTWAAERLYHVVT